MTNEQCFEIWAPDASPWSVWAKPVLFSQMDDLALRAGPVPDVEGQLPEFDQGTALIVDLPGRDAVRAGLELARKGWRPIPLFNATRAMKAIVDVVPTIETLYSAAEALQAIPIREDAPPAFLLDERRMRGVPRPGDYDNRSITLPQDFPSANFLRAHGISRAILVQEDTSATPDDLDHVLLRWRQGGVGLRHQTLKGSAGELDVVAPSLFRIAWYRMSALLGLRRNNVGGFGAMIPEASAGGWSGGYG